MIEREKDREGMTEVTRARLIRGGIRECIYTSVLYIHLAVRSAPNAVVHSDFFHEAENNSRAGWLLDRLCLVPTA